VCVNLVAGPLNRASNEANQKGKHNQMKTDTKGGGVEVDGGGSGTMVSRATEEREHLAVSRKC
jgi:hypothetical protein